MHKFRFFIFALLLISSISFVLSEVSVQIISPNEYYSDAKEVTLSLRVSGVPNGNNYVFSLVNNDNHSYTTSNSWCNAPECYSSSSNYSFNITQGVSSFDVNYKLTLKSNANLERTSDNFTSSIDCDTCTIFSQPLSISLKSGKPTFSAVTQGSVSGVGTTFAKSEAITLKIKDLVDNSDDKGFGNVPENLECKVYKTTNGANSELSYLSKSQTSASDINVGIINTNDLNTSGDNKFKIICNDGAIQTEKEVSFSMQDNPTEIVSVSLSPTTIYPDKEVTCLANAKDIDDPDQAFDINYSWYLNSVRKNVLGTKFKCTQNQCKSGDEVRCVAIAKGVSGTSQAKDTKISVSNYIKNLAISGPSRVQKGQKNTYNSTFEYSGSSTVKYQWKLGDGSAVKTSRNTDYAYQNKGDYTITLELDDSKGSKSSVTHRVTVLDPDVIIDIKSPITGQDVDRGSEVNIRVDIKDSTASPITTAKVYAKIVAGEEEYADVNLSPLSSSAGIYEGIMSVPYNIPENSEIEVFAEYTKGNTKLNSAKSVPISVPLVELKPNISIITSSIENEGKVSVGNKIIRIEICMEYADGSFSDKFDTLKAVIYNGVEKEYSLQKENKCFSSALDVLIEDSDEFYLTVPRNTKDSYGNYVRTSFKQNYQVVKLPAVYDVVVSSPSTDTKIAYGQNVIIRARINPLNNISLSDLSDVNLTLEYLDKTYNLTYDSGDYITTIENSSSDKFSFKISAAATYNGIVNLKSLNKDYEINNNLEIVLTNPGEQGELYDFSNIILQIKYPDGTIYDDDSLIINISGKDYNFVRTEDGDYKSKYDLSLFTPYNLKFEGSDLKLNKLSKEYNIPATSYLMPLIYYIVGVVVMIFFIISIVLYTRFIRAEKKVDESQRAIELARKEIEAKVSGKSSQDLEIMLDSKKAERKALINRYFKERSISEAEFRAEASRIDSVIKVLEEKITPKEDSNSNNDYKSDEAIKRLIIHFKKNNWDDSKIRSYLEKEGIQKEIIDYIISSIRES